MIEILNIILQFTIFLILFSFPFCLYKEKVFLFSNSFVINGIYLRISLNILIHINLLLIISFLNIRTEIYFYLIIFLSIISNILFFLSKKKIKVNLDDLLILIAFTIITLGFFFITAIDLKLEWDGLNHWFPKALNFYNFIEVQNLKNLGFSEYPHLGPYIWAFFWKNSYLEYEYFGRLFYIFFYVTSLFCIIEKKFGKNFLLKIVILFLLSILSFDNFLFGGYQGYLIFSILIILSQIIYDQKLNQNIKTKSFIFYFFIIWIFHALIWFKDEGIFYYLFIIIPFIFFTNTNKKYLLILISIFFVILQGVLQKYLIGNYGFQAEIMHDKLLDNFKPVIFYEKFLLISKYILISIIKYKLWIVNLFSLIILFLFYKKEFLRLKLWIYILIINILFIYAIYFHTPYDLEFLLKVTLDRIMFHTSGFYLIFPILLLKNTILKKNNY